jgi:outer membrane protein OmpU
LGQPLQPGFSIRAFWDEEILGGCKLKKFLFSTTALAVAGAFAFGVDANAAAKPIKMAVGGFMTTEMGFSNNDGGFETGDTNATAISNKRADFNNVQDSEVYFTGSTKLDNGIALSITIQLEADQVDANIIDESYMKMTGSFGDLRLGSTTGTNSVLKHIAPYVGIGLDGGSSDNYISVPAAVTASGSTNAATSGDANKIAYITPRFGNGAAIGISWTPSTVNANTAPVTGGNDADQAQVLELALSYETTIGTSSVKLDLAAEDVSNNTRKYRGGGHVGVGGFTVGGSYSRQTNDNDATRDKTIAYDLGVSYVMGAYKFGIATVKGSRDFGNDNEDEEQKWSIGAQYAIDTGVTGTLTFVNADYEDGATGLPQNSNDGHALIGQIKVAF